MQRVMRLLDVGGDMQIADGDACLGVMSALSALPGARPELCRVSQAGASQTRSPPNLANCVKTEHARTLQRFELQYPSTSPGLSHNSANSTTIALFCNF